MLVLLNIQAPLLTVPKYSLSIFLQIKTIEDIICDHYC